LYGFIHPEGEKMMNPGIPSFNPPQASIAPQQAARASRQSAQPVFGCAGTDSIHFGKKQPKQNVAELVEKNIKKTRGIKHLAIGAAEVGLGAFLAVPAGLTAHAFGLLTFGLGHVVGVALHIIGGLMAADGLARLGAVAFNKFKKEEVPAAPPSADNGADEDAVDAPANDEPLTPPGA
jgi:hypothetical protein